MSSGGSRCLWLLAAGLFALSACSGVARDGGSGPAGLRVAKASPGPTVRPEQLMGLSASEVTRVLGAADFRRSDGPAEIWQYRDGTCVLDLYFYGGAPDEMRVEHAAARDRSPLGSGGDGCTTHSFSETRGPASG